MFARTPLLQKHARPGLNSYIETLSGKRVCLMFIIQIRSDDNFRVANITGNYSVRGHKRVYRDLSGETSYNWNSSPE